MEEQLHHPYGHSSGAHDEEEKKTTIKKVKEKVHKLKETIKHGHGHHHDDETIMNESPAVRSGMVEPTDMGKAVLVEDLYTTHSDILDPPVRSFAQWEEEERRGAPPPLSTEYRTDLYLHDLGKPTAPKDSCSTKIDESSGGIAKSTSLEDDPSAPTVYSPSNYQTKVVDPTKTGGKEAGGITEVLRSFNKMGVYDSKSSDSDKNKGTGSHDQFAPEPDKTTFSCSQSTHENKPEVYTGSDDQLSQSTPLRTVTEEPPSEKITTVTEEPPSSYSGKIRTVAEKAAEAKDMIASKLGENMSTDTISSKVTETLSPVYETVIGVGSSVMSKMKGSGHTEETTRITEKNSKGGSVKDYLAETLTPGEDDKVLSEAITQAFHLPRKQVIEENTTIYVKDEGERRLQDSTN